MNEKDYSDEITTFLNDSEAIKGRDQAQLYKMIYADLKNIARNRLASEANNGGTVSVTVLVNEAFMKLDSTHTMSWKSRRHYFGAAAEAMRRILIDRARYHQRARREGSKAAIELEEGIHVVGVKSDDIVELNDALSDLEKFDDDLAMLVKLKYFAGLSAEEIAELVDSSSRTVARNIQTARAWLLTQMKKA